LEFRTGIIASYSELFESGDEEDEQDFSSEGQFARKWGWYQSIYTLAGGRIEKFDTVTALPLNQCLNYLLFEKDKNKIEVAQLNKKQ
jgi:hypothetical protein